MEIRLPKVCVTVFYTKFSFFPDPVCVDPSRSLQILDLAK